MSERVERLAIRLRKGIERTMATFADLGPEQWEAVVYEEPHRWTMRNLLVHFLSAEIGLLRLAQDIAAGGRGAPETFDYDAHNVTDQERYADVPLDRLLSDMAAAREETIRWVERLTEEDLDRTGYHPALAKITLEEFVTAIHGHHLMHLRELKHVTG